jgi:hypothetical protein
VVDYLAKYLEGPARDNRKPAIPKAER